jgi:hypothetical protein
MAGRWTGPNRTIALTVTAFAAAVVALLLLVHFGVIGGSTTPEATHGSGVAAAEARELPPFRDVELAGSNNVMIRVGGTQSVVVHADRNLLHRVTTVVRGDSLVIGNIPGSFTNAAPMIVEVRMPSLAALRLSGSGNVFATGIESRRFEVSLPGSGVVHAAGSATRLVVTLEGSGVAQLMELAARKVRATIPGSGRILVTATASLDASIGGSGAITYFGRPAHLTTSVTGSGAIVPGDG